MNFLAHIYLSGENELLRIGNFSADGIKGKHYKKYPLDMQAGILLHRQIDTFTDAHPIVKQSTKRLHKHYSHYSGVIVDIYYDHFLAKNWDSYSSVALPVFVQDFYDSLNRHFDILPERVKRLTPIMIEQNWLESYQRIEGIQKVLNGMNRRTKGISKMNEATKELQEHYQAFENDFKLFFSELESFSKAKKEELKIQFSL